MNIEEALTRSPQIEARGYLQPVDVPGFGTCGSWPVISDQRRGPRSGSAEESGSNDSARDAGLLRQDPVFRPLEGVRILDFTQCCRPVRRGTGTLGRT